MHIPLKHSRSRRSLSPRGQNIAARALDNHRNAMRAFHLDVSLARTYTLQQPYPSSASKVVGEAYGCQQKQYSHHCLGSDCQGDGIETCTDSSTWTTMPRQRGERWQRRWPHYCEQIGTSVRWRRRWRIQEAYNRLHTTCSMGLNGRIAGVRRQGQASKIAFTRIEMSPRSTISGVDAKGHNCTVEVCASYRMMPEQELQA
eukprot:scaffold287010_cov33-Tisochrysis_lutea.AAC.2